ncbi:hypothetical protein BZA70DRAFT_89234 [Myxozyma melibiosi]|uniref:ABM domain-containing protein n=1 Tax=Myxozyma melibiosi TaxID=54550 RepID=A0ABR1F1P3_9ASCO
MKSPGFEVFAAGATPLFAKPFDLADYEPANIGFLTRPGVGREFIKDSIVLSVEFELKPGTRDRFLADAEVLAADVLANEPNCLSYYYMKSLDNPDKVGIFERYKTRHDIDVVHRGAEVFKKIFGGFEKDGILVKRSIIECTDSGVGFLERA